MPGAWIGWSIRLREARPIRYIRLRDALGICQDYKSSARLTASARCFSGSGKGSEINFKLMKNKNLLLSF